MYDIWDSGAIDRLKIDLATNTKMEVNSVEFSPYFQKCKKRCKHFDRMPIHLLPNCVSYLGENNKLSWLHALFGFKKRSDGQGGLMIGWRNTDRNGFLMYMMNLMGHERDEGNNKEYWRLAKKLLHNDAFKITCFNYVVKNWHQDLNSRQVNKILKEVDSYIENLSGKIDYRRVYIPKSTGWRPLGVPTLSWRVYLHMWNVLVVWFRIKEVENQHAYLPKKGVYTVWQDIWPKLNKENNAYEFDLEQFFPNVSLEYLKNRMMEIGIPAEISEYLTTLNRSLVKLKKEDLLLEPHRMVLFDSDGSINENLPRNVKLILRASESLDSLLEKGYVQKADVGVPQGAATSCALSTLNLKELFIRHPNLSMYADDGIDFPANSLNTPGLTVKEAGVLQAPKKSYWVKVEGKWKKSVKFVGLEYIPAGITPIDGGPTSNIPRLRGSTRKGSKLELTKDLQFLCYVSKVVTEASKSLESSNVVELLFERMGIKTIGNLIEILFDRFSKLDSTSQIGHFFDSPSGPSMLSCIFNNSLELQEPADGRLLYKKRSWVHSHFGSYLHSVMEHDLPTVHEVVKYRRDQEEIKTLPDPSRVEKLQFLVEFLENKEESASHLSLVAKNSLFKFKKDMEASHNAEISKFRSEGSYEKFKEIRKIWKTIQGFLTLNLFNASTMACDHILIRREDNLSIKNWSRNSEVLYCKSQRMVRTNKDQLQKEFKESVEKVKTRMRKRLKKELKQLVHLPKVYSDIQDKNCTAA